MTRSKKQRTFISFEIDPDTREAFSQQLESEGKTISSVLRQFIEDYLANAAPPQDMTEVIRRLEAVEKRVGIENARLVGESVA